MTRGSPGTGCYDLAFQASWPIDETGALALEDYARAVTQASAAEVTRASDDPVRVRGVHVCGLAASLTPALLTDVEDFARSVAVHPGEGGLGWS